MVFNMLLAFIIAMFTGVTIRTPPLAWITVGLSGMLGWGASEFAVNHKIPELVAVVIGAIVVGVTAEIFARVQKQPVTVYIVSAIIPLVPGTIAYNSMLAFMDNRFNEGLFLGFKAFLIASYLATGLAIVPVVVRYVRAVLSKGKGTMGR